MVKAIEIIYKTEHGKIVHGDNIEVMQKIKESSVDSCISDFPYDLSFMGKKWDTTGNFYEWCKERSIELHRIIKSGGYVAIFGHPKTNHRMKCAFEDTGFNIVEEVDWVYGTGFPKNQDIGKLFDKKNNKDLAKRWNGYKTAGLKPAHEPITIFQKPLEGTYINNIEKYECGGMNIDGCRIPTSQEDKDVINAKASKNPTTNYSDSDERIYGAYAEDKSMPANEIGRFPANIILDSYIGEILDGQSGFSKSVAGFRNNNNTESLLKKDLKEIQNQYIPDVLMKVEQVDIS